MDFIGIVFHESSTVYNNKEKIYIVCKRNYKSIGTFAVKSSHLFQKRNKQKKSTNNKELAKLVLEMYKLEFCYLIPEYMA